MRLTKKFALTSTFCRVAPLLIACAGFPCAGESPLVLWGTVVPGAVGQNLTVGPGGKIYLISNSQGVLFYNLDRDGNVTYSHPSTGEGSHGIAADAQGSYYLTGAIGDPVAFGAGQTNNFFVAKYAPGGARLWVQTGGSADYSPNIGCSGVGVALDAQGNVLTFGNRYGSAVFGNVNLTDDGGVFLCKYDPDGRLLWAKTAVRGAYGYGNHGYAYGLAVDAGGNAVVTGALNNGPADFGGSILNVNGPYAADFFIAKYDPNGALLWAKVGYGGNDAGVAVDSKGNVYFNGAMAGSTVLHCGKFSPGGQLLWEHYFSWALGTGVMVDNHDEPVFTGYYEGLVDFGGHVLQSTSPSKYQLVLFKTDPQGTVQWALSSQGADYCRGYYLIGDGQGSIYLSGSFTTSATLGTLPLGPLYSTSGNNFFVARITERPPLSISQGPQRVTLSWSAQATGYVLESSDSLSAPTWVPVPDAPVLAGSQELLQLPIDSTHKFFRLHKPQ